MRTVNITKFKEKCLEFLKSENIKKEPLFITKRGKVIAVVSAPDRKILEKTSLKNSIRFHTESIENVSFLDKFPLI